MPTGYTAAVVDGKVTEFKDFALQCARAFGALSTMRDDPNDAPIPERFEPSTYYSEQLAKAKDRLGHLNSMTSQEAEAETLAAYERECAYANESNARADAENSRLDEMAAHVAAWTPPTAQHEELKRFMLEQLRISKHTYRADAPKKLTGQEWFSRESEKAVRDIAYHAEESEKERARAQERTAWVAALRASLP